MSWSPGPGWSSSHRSQGASHCERGREMIVTFTINGEDIPRIVDQPIRSLGRLYTSGLSDKDMGKIILRQLSEGLSKIDASQLPGEFKVWWYHFTLYPRVMWPLKLCEVTSSAVSRMEAKANSFIRKWLGLPRCFSAAGLYGWNSLKSWNPSPWDTGRRRQGWWWN